MSNSVNTRASEMLYIKDYASFVKKSKSDDFISLYLINLNSFKTPILEIYSHLNRDQILEVARKGLLRFLTGIEADKGIEHVKQTLENWKNNKIPGIPREVISIKDITLIYAAQKLSFQSFIPYYTTDITVASQLIVEIELFYTQVLELTLEMLDAIRLEERQIRLETEDKYRDLFDNAYDLIQIIDISGKILYVNNAWLKTLGYNKEDLKNKLIFDVIKESELDNYKDCRKKIIEGTIETVSIRTCYINKNGEEISVEGFISTKRKNGKPEYTQGILRDITLKIKQEAKINFYVEQLAEREENLNNIIENGPDGVIVIDKDSSIITWNLKAEEIFGWKKAEVFGKEMTKIIVPDRMREGHGNGIKRYLTFNESNILNKTIEVPAIHKNGNEFYISLTVSHSIQGGRDTFIAFIRDITEEKRNQLELEHKKLQLEKSHKELEQYAWLTSHDLKEPLRKILIFSDSLIKRQANNVSDHILSYLKKINNSASRMSLLIESVLEYSNVEVDQDLFTPTDLNAVLQDVLEDLELVILSSNATINIDPLPEIEAIPAQMRQLFQNLITNAIKYSNQNVPPVIDIQCNKKNAGYEIFVCDNGIGFEKKYAEKIFQVFQRLTKKSHEGTGIGLALCKKITEAHKGSIHAIGEPGRGSKFTIYLPTHHS